MEGIGFFPDARRPRVVWIGCTGGDDRLHRLRSAIEDDLSALGFPRDERTFHPHFTIGRVRSEGVPHHLTSLPKNCTFDPHHTVVNEIFLMRSVLKPGGSEYSVVGSAKST
jgi:2'-5' RNA ligase